MQVGRALKRQARAIATPALFLALTGYFLWSATQGEHGLEADARRQNDLRVAQAQLAAAQHDLHAWDLRVGALRNSRLDVDSLDERARAVLNVALPDEIVVTLGPAEHLF
jgi:cell division protein FtsB